MIYFKDSDGQVFAFESKEEADTYGPPGLNEMTAEEVEAHLHPESTYAEEYAALTAKHRDELAAYDRAYLTAIRADGPKEEARQQEVREQVALCVAKFDADVIELLKKHGIE